MFSWQIAYLIILDMTMYLRSAHSLKVTKNFSTSIEKMAASFKLKDKTEHTKVTEFVTKQNESSGKHVMQLSSSELQGSVLQERPFKTFSGRICNATNLNAATSLSSASPSIRSLSTSAVFSLFFRIAFSNASLRSNMSALESSLKQKTTAFW